MEYTTIIEFINGVGFPIAVTVALFYQNNKQDERYDKQMKELSKVIENNTLTLTELNIKMGAGVKSNG